MSPSLPPPIALYQTSIGHYGSRALSLAAKLGIAADPSALARVLRFLVSMGVFDEEEDGRCAYLLEHGIHDWNDERAAAILRNVLVAIPAHGRLRIVEGLDPTRIDRSPESRGATAKNVDMLVNTGGRQRSEAEFRELFAASGFRLARVAPTVPGVSVIEGECV